MDFDNPKVYGDTFISDGLVYVGRDFTKSAVGVLINLFFASKADLFLSPE